MEKKTIYHIILDQSGSMGDCIQSTISGFNEQLQKIEKMALEFPEQKILVGLTRFNSVVIPTAFAQPVHTIKPLTTDSYIPNGSTALLDAIGTTCLRIENEFTEDLKNDTTVIIAILTDGYENSSRRFSSRVVRNLIKELEGTGKWTFTYLGATIDAVETASALNIQKQNSRSIKKEDIDQSFFVLSNSLMSYMQERRKGSNPQHFLKEDQK